MTAGTTPRSQPLPPLARQAVAAMYGGLALTALGTVLVPLAVALGTDRYRDHIRHAYPDYGTGEVNHYQLVILVYLAVNGVIGLAAWLWTVGKAKRRSRTVHITGTVLFGLGLSSGLINMLTKDSTGYTALSPLLGIVGLLPSVAGLVVVVLLWRARDAVPTDQP